MKLSAAITVCFAVVSLANAYEVVQVEDPSDIADQFLDQMQFDEIDNQQNRAQMYADELQGLNKVEANNRDDDLGESNQYDVASGVAECGSDTDCQAAVRDIVSSAASLGEAEDKKENDETKTDEKQDPSCMDYHTEICGHKKALCDSKKHGAQISAQCPKTCRVCEMFSQAARTQCQDRTDACKVDGRKKYCKVAVVSQICPILCDSCPSSKGAQEFSETME